MSALSELLQAHRGDRSVRQIGRECAKYDVGESTVIPYFNGTHGNNLAEQVLVALSHVMPLDIRQLREAAGVPRGEPEPYAPPPEFNRLSRVQRAALDEFVKSFVGPLGNTDGMDETPKPRTPRKATKAQEAVIHRPDWGKAPEPKGGESEKRAASRRKRPPKET